MQAEIDREKSKRTKVSEVVKETGEEGRYVTFDRVVKELGGFANKLNITGAREACLYAIAHGEAKICQRSKRIKFLDMEEIAERSYDDMETFLIAKDLANAKLDSAFDMYAAAEKGFAEEYNINLVEGEKTKRDEKIAKASKALTYYNEIFLITFRASVQEAYVLDALNRSDLISLEQSNNALEIATNEALAELDSAEKFGSDPKLILAAKQLLEFYRLESTRDFSKMVDFYLKKDKFDKLAEMMKTKKQKDLTKEEIEAYNTAVEDYNKMIPEFNNLTERSNDRRKQANERWSDRVEEFFDIHA
jgi:hypothetical protein